MRLHVQLLPVVLPPHAQKAMSPLRENSNLMKYRMSE